MESQYWLSQIMVEKPPQSPCYATEIFFKNAKVLPFTKI